MAVNPAVEHPPFYVKLDDELMRNDVFDDAIFDPAHFYLSALESVLKNPEEALSAIKKIQADRELQVEFIVRRQLLMAGVARDASHLPQIEIEGLDQRLIDILTCTDPKKFSYLFENLPSLCIEGQGGDEDELENPFAIRYNETPIASQRDLVIGNLAQKGSVIFARIIKLIKKYPLTKPKESDDPIQNWSIAVNNSMRNFLLIRDVMLRIRQQITQLAKSCGGASSSQMQHLCLRLFFPRQPDFGALERRNPSVRALPSSGDDDSSSSAPDSQDH